MTDENPPGPEDEGYPVRIELLADLPKEDRARFLLERGERRKEIYVEHLEREQASWRDLVKVFGARTVTLLATLNGGAIALLLNAIANIQSADQPWQVLSDSFFWAFVFFGVGLACAVFVSGFGYLNGAAGEGTTIYAHERHQILIEEDNPEMVGGIQAPDLSDPINKPLDPFLVIAGTYKDKANAGTKVKQYENLGISAEIIHLYNSKLHAICIARSSTEKEANDTMTNLIANYNIKAYVYKTP